MNQIAMRRVQDHESGEARYAGVAANSPAMAPVSESEIALDWHIGETTMRLPAATERNVIGWNRSGAAIEVSV